MECLDTVDLQTLRDACEAMGLPTSGTKLDCWHCLQSGGSDGRTTIHPSMKDKAMIKHVAYKGDPPSDDIVRMILMFLAEQGVAARRVCKAWLNISNSLTPFFLNRMMALQAQNAKTKEAAMHFCYYRANSSDQARALEWAADISVMRLTLKAPREKMIDMLASYQITAAGDATTNDLAMMLAQQLHYETDTDDDEEEEEEDVDEEDVRMRQPV